jgi:hypothetical protein
MQEAQIVREHIDEAKVLRESGVHKLVIADREGHCLAYLLAWDRFEYHDDTDTYVCFVERDGRELMTFYAEGDVKQEDGTSRYVVMAPATSPSHESGGPTRTSPGDSCFEHQDVEEFRGPGFRASAHLPL